MKIDHEGHATRHHRILLRLSSLAVVVRKNTGAGENAGKI